MLFFSLLYTCSFELPFSDYYMFNARYLHFSKIDFFFYEWDMHYNMDQHLDTSVKTFLYLFICDFSFEDESKISNMLTETRRNREMCNQIARKVFFNQSHTTKVAPVGPDVSMMVLTIRIKLYKRTKRTDRVSKLPRDYEWCLLLSLQLYTFEL